MEIQEDSGLHEILVRPYNSAPPKWEHLLPIYRVPRPTATPGLRRATAPIRSKAVSCTKGDIGRRAYS